MHILWCITGAGFKLNKTVEIMSKISKKHTISVCFSKIGKKVAKMYGFFKKIENISKFIYSDIEYSTKIARNICLKNYDKIIIAPCTTNSIAKMVYGICDTLVTNAYSDSQKNKIESLIFPTDQKKEIKIKIPFYIKDKLCDCEICYPQKYCPKDAIKYNGRLKIDFDKCNSCYICIEKCPKDAIVKGYPMKIYAKQIDLNNLDKLKNTQNVTILKSPKQLLEIIK